MGIPDPNRANVIFTDAKGKPTTIAQDEGNGWSFDDPTAPTTVILHGQACARLKQESTGKIEGELGCATRVN